MLRPYTLPFLGKTLFYNQLAKFNVKIVKERLNTIEPHNLIYPYQNSKEDSPEFTKIKFVRKLSPAERKVQEKIDFEKLKRKIAEEAAIEAAGGRKDEGAPKDRLFEAGQQPKWRTYDRITTKELYYYPKIAELHQYNSRKTSYLKDFIGPFPIQEESVSKLIDECEADLVKSIGAPVLSFVNPEFDADEEIAKLESVKKNLYALAAKIPKLNYRLYPNIAINLAFRLKYKKDFAGIWSAMQTELWKVMHNIGTQDILRLEYAWTAYHPKCGDPKMHKAFANIICQDLPGLDLNEVLHVYHAFRNTHYPQIHNAVYNQLITSDYSKTLAADPDAIANLLYTYVNCRLDKYDRKRHRLTLEELKEAQKLVEKYFDTIVESLPNMSPDALVRLCLALNITRIENFKDLHFKIERHIPKILDKLDAFHVANILYSFSKANNGLSAGKDSFYKALEPFVVKFFDQMNGHDQSRVYYAYAQR